MANDALINVGPLGRFPDRLLQADLVYVVTLLPIVERFRWAKFLSSGEQMATITWNPQTMATGIAEVDAQHQEWIHRYNLFEDAISQGKGVEAVQSTLDFFISYAETHFGFEESVMDKRHCPAAMENRVDHEYMRNILRGYKAYVDKQGFSISEVHSLRHQMKEWLIKHILTVDIQLRDS